MTKKKQVVYPYIPNSVPSVRRQMLAEIGVPDVNSLFEPIPEALRLDRRLNLPEPLLSEQDLRAHVEGLLARNASSNQRLNFRGAGCYQHYVPAVCDEINSRGEFLTAYAGEPYEDHGRFQALFEYASMMGELLEMDVVNVPNYDGFQAAATSILMASRITGRQEVLVSASVSGEKFTMMRSYCEPGVSLRRVSFNTTDGLLDVAALQQALSDKTAAVYFENPSYLGVIEEQAQTIASLGHESGAICVVGTDPISLGVITPPVTYGADIVCGDIQPLGMHMQFGGGQAGFIATRDEEAYVMQYPSRLFGIAPTMVPGEYGFGDVAYERTSFAVREQGKEWVGTATALWGITAGVYLALMGPQGMEELGEAIIQRSHYAAMRIGAICGVRSPALDSPFFQEFVVNFDGTGKSVAEVNEGLLEHGIFGGVDLTAEFPDLGQSALYCVTEVHTQAEIDHLATALAEVLQ
ncbi:MAG: aminomethyl-transferring glycine dehydrogenase subunit GcvPA [Anaerolineales bacterium]